MNTNIEKLDKSITATLYQYVEEQSHQYENFPIGDVALVIKDVPIFPPHTMNKLVHICFPDPDVFKSNTVPEARPIIIVGWGQQRYEIDEDKLSCNTNGARTKSLGTSENAVQGIFVPSKRYDNSPVAASKYC